MEMRSQFASSFVPPVREDAPLQTRLLRAPGEGPGVPAGNRFLPVPVGSSRMNVELIVELGSPAREGGHFLGSSSAPVTIVEYGDFECRHCGRAYSVLRQIRELVGDRLRFVFRNFPITTIHPHAQNAAEAAEAAASQGCFWQMHDALFEHQTQLSGRHLRLYASRSGLDMDRFNREIAAQTWAPTVRHQFLGGVRSGVNETPTFFINGVRYMGLIDAPSLRSAIENAA